MVMTLTSEDTMWTLTDHQYNVFINALRVWFAYYYRFIVLLL